MEGSRRGPNNLLRCGSPVAPNCMEHAMERKMFFRILGDASFTSEHLSKRNPTFLRFCADHGNTVNERLFLRGNK